MTTQRARPAATALATAILAMGAVLLPTPPASAQITGNYWGMDLSGNVVADANATQPLTYTGQGVLSATGLVGGAVELTQAPSLGTVAGSQEDNPGTQNFAMGVVFTTQPIPSRGYAGNVMQKGLFADAGQVKLQLVPASLGTVNCRIKGTRGARIVTSTVTVDDGAWHTAVCWRSGNTVGVTVDGVVKSLLWNPGSVGNRRTLLLGNKGANSDASDQHFGRTDYATWVIDPQARSIVEQRVAASG